MIRRFDVTFDLTTDTGNVSKTITMIPSEQQIEDAIVLAKFEGRECDSTHLFRILCGEFVREKNLLKVIGEVINSLDKTPLIHSTQFPESPPDTDPSPSYHGPERVDVIDYEEDGEP